MEIMRAVGTNGTIIAYEDKVVIVREKLSAKFISGFKGERTIYYSDMASVEHKRPSMTGGYIFFVIPGSASKAPVLPAMGVVPDSISQDENTVLFMRLRMANESDAIFDYIQKKIRESKLSSSSVNVNSNSMADELLKFKNLLDMGAITEDEYNAKKKQLLNL